MEVKGRGETQGNYDKEVVGSFIPARLLLPEMNQVFCRIPFLSD